MTDVEVELRMLLENDMHVNALNDKRVYYQEGPQKEQETYVVFNTSDQPVRTKDGIAGWEKTLLIVCYGQNNSRVVHLQNAVIDALEGYSSNSIYAIEVQEKNQEKNQELNIYQRSITAIIETN